MPPGPTAPRSLAGLLAEFRPCFTAPTFQTFIGLVVGLIAQTRRRTVCGMLTGAGLEQVWHHSDGARRNSAVSLSEIPHLWDEGDVRSLTSVLSCVSVFSACRVTAARARSAA